MSVLADPVAFDQSCVADITERWSQCLDHHIPVPTGIGSARASLTRKVHNLLHSLMIDLGTWKRVKRLCDQVISITTDMGVESLLMEAPSCVLTDGYLPELTEAIDPDTHVDDGDCDSKGPWWAAAQAAQAAHAAPAHGDTSD
eukprot:4792380-Alexandrium_andersonii.AAC.1